MTESWYVVQVLCRGPGEDEAHDYLKCPGGEWLDEFSFTNARGGPEAMLAIFRESAEDPSWIRLVRRTEEVLDL